jgi:hypothetical protein
MIIRTLLALLSLGLLIAATGSTQAEEKTDPIVVELFTSQGCSSCPPADQFLGDLAGQPGILALSFHVDYWDYIGWKDPYAMHLATQRQRKYAHSFDIPYVYTPQMVVQGSAQAVGSDRGDVEAAIARVRAKHAAHPIVSIERHGDGGLTVRVGAGESQGPATVWLVCFDRRHETDIPRGENAGARLVDHHVVRQIESIGNWKGEPLELSVAPASVSEFLSDPNSGVAALVQSGGTGPILTAVVLQDQH